MGNINLGPFDPPAPLGVDDDGDFADYETVLLWHLLARTLCRGASGRPGLPLEIVLAIFRAADFIAPSASMTVSSSRALDLLCEDERTDYVETWFTTAPLTQATLGRLAGVQLHTFSHDACSTKSGEKASFAWYNVGIKRESDEQDDEPGRDPWGWESHRNRLGGDGPVRLCGPLLGQDHPLLQEAREGDILSVIAVAACKGTHNIALRGHLRFWTYFEPVIL